MFKNSNINIFLAIVITLIFGFWVGRDTSFINNVVSENNTIASSEIDKLVNTSSIPGNLFSKVWNILHTQYFYKNIDDKSMYYAAIQGATAALNDPVTLFYTPQETQDYNKVISGDSFSGIGVELGYKNNQVIIERVLPDGPAFKANVAVGYEIVGIDNKAITSTASIDDIVNAVKGATGTKVTISFLDPSNNQTLNVTMTREPIQVNSIDVKDLGNGIVQMQVNRFTDVTLDAWDNNWNTAVNKVLSYNPKGLVLDLRGNPGGYFEGAVYAAGSFLPAGTLVASQQDRDGNKTPFSTDRSPDLNNLKTVVLVNGGSASAAEILAGALQNYKKVTVVGENTYGKGTAQNIINFSDGSTLHLTTLHWLLPNGRWIQHSSPIIPDVIVDYPVDQFKQGIDPQLQKAENLLQ